MRLTSRLLQFNNEELKVENIGFINILEIKVTVTFNDYKDPGEEETLLLCLLTLFSMLGTIIGYVRKGVTA